MADLELPMAMFCLSALSKDPTVYEQASDLLPPHEANLKDPKIRDIQKLLDAIVYFLPVPIDKGFAFALSMGVAADAVVATISGNDEMHFDREFGRTPAETVLLIWDKLKCIAQSDRTTSQLNELVAYLLQRQEERVGKRFKKRTEPFLNAAETVFHVTSKFCDPALEKTGASYNAYVLALQKARTSYNKDAIKPPYPWHDFQEKVKDRLGLPQPFDLVRYTDKLCTPAVHISRLLKTAQNCKLKEIFHLPLNVTEVKPRVAPQNPSNRPANQDIRSFLAHCYGDSAPSDEIIVSEVLDTSLDTISRLIGSRSTLSIQTPHCECILAHHHLSQESTPFPYIAVSKSLSCLTCGLYLVACGKYIDKRQGRETIRFQTRGCHADAIPLVALPSGSTTSDLDDFVKREIMNTVKRILKVVLRNSVNKERMRRLSQSVAGSDGSSGDSLENMLEDSAEVLAKYSEFSKLQQVVGSVPDT